MNYLKGPAWFSMRRVVSVGMIVLAGVVVTLYLLAGGKVKPPAGSTDGRWNEIGDQPAILMGQHVQPYTLWNDPSVLRDGNGFRMWLSGGDARNLKRIVVEVYEAHSADGAHWNIDAEPVLRPSQSGWDSLRIETPSVIKVNGVYHMYYTGFDEAGANSGISQIGHATSADGTHWKKDSANPVLQGQSTDKHKWAYGGVGNRAFCTCPDKRLFFCTTQG